MNGQPGTTDTVAEHEAFLEAAKANPDVKITGDLYGMWTGAVAKSEMLNIWLPIRKGWMRCGRRAIWGLASARRWSKPAGR